MTALLLFQAALALATSLTVTAACAAVFPRWVCLVTGFLVLAGFVALGWVV